MSLPVYVDFAPLGPANPTSVALVQRPLCAHIHIGRFSSEIARLAQPNRSVLLDKGIVRCPAELDLAYDEIALHLEDEGAGADVFVEPITAAAGLQLDLLLERTTDGKAWTSEKLLEHCCCAGVLRTAEIPELSGTRARIKVRVTATHTANALIRVWANEPRRSQAKAKLLASP